MIIIISLFLSLSLRALSNFRIGAAHLPTNRADIQSLFFKKERKRNPGTGATSLPAVKYLLDVRGSGLQVCAVPPGGVGLQGCHPVSLTGPGHEGGSWGGG